jgi:type IV pilus assembly protein PilY1
MERNIMNASIDNTAPRMGAAGRGTLFPGGIFLLSFLLLLAFFPLAAKAQFAISQSPLVIGAGAAANLLYVHDDSGSMYWSFMPNRYSDASHTNAAYNKIYFDPSVTYEPPVNADGSSLGNSLYTAAWFDGYDLAGRNDSGNYCVNSTWSSGSEAERTVRRRVNLSSQYKPTAYYGCYYLTSDYQEFLTGTVMSGAYYYSGGTRVNIGTNPFQQQNFANWYSYYRTRNYAARAGISRAFVNLDSRIRVGWATINRIRTHGVGAITNVRPFTGQHKQNFYNWLFSKNKDGTGTGPNGGTPLLGALNAAGQYYETNTDAWRDDPANSQSSLSGAACRKSFTILMTDGYYNDSSSIGNMDGATTTTFTPPGKPGGAAVSPLTVQPFRDDHSNTLADIAWHYWSRDLQGGVANNAVVGTTRDPAWWQHMTTYTIGLGVSGSKDKATAFHNADEGIAQTWPAIATVETDPSKIDDLLHAAVNGHGDFFAAQNPQEFVDGMASIIKSIQTEAGSVSKVAKADDSGKNRDKVGGSTLAYEVKYNPDNWWGQLLAYGVCTADEARNTSIAECAREGQVKATRSWDAGDKIPAAASRNILSWNTETNKGIDFKFDQLSTAQQAQLVRGPADPASLTPQLNAPNGQAILDYVRGDASKETTTPPLYRVRDGHLLGDIFSNPVYFGPVASRGYDDAQVTGLAQTERDAYAAWRVSEEYKNTQGRLFVGANDGMLHGFDAMTGDEKVAYVPASVIHKLWKLADRDYGHEFYADATPIVEEGWFDSKWHNVLVGSAGAGGNSYFALDVTSTDSTAATLVTKGDALWEFTDPELGYNGAGQAMVARLKGQNGKWAAIFGNGYNSASHKAQLFVVSLSDGALLRVIDTGVGDAAHPNGLSAPAAVDAKDSENRDGVVGVVYAGDVRGNLWRFDLSDEDPGNWSVSKLLEAKGPTGAAQPITAPPLVVRKRDSVKSGNLVYVGTGKFFEASDVNDASVQSFYAVLDTGSGGPYSRDNGLVQQTIVSSGTQDGRNAQNTSAKSVNYTTDHGFFLDLGETESKERSVARADVFMRSKTSGSVLFYSMEPTGDQCKGGSAGWVTELDALSGARLTKGAVLAGYNRIQKGTGAGGTHMGGTGEQPLLDGTNCIGEGCDAFQKTCGGEENLGGGDSVKLALECLTRRGRQSWRQLR